MTHLHDAFGHLGRHVEIHDVAFVVLDDEQSSRRRCRRPRAAAIIWSGVGEVNTWPGQAASSMPWPTKPACSGSWPEPPPEISATLPGFERLAADELVAVAERDDIGMRRREAVEAFGQHVVDGS